MNACLRIVGLEYRNTRARLMLKNLWELTNKTVTHYNKMLCHTTEDASSHARTYLLISELELH